MSRAKIAQICKDLGIQNITVVDDELRGRCPFGQHEDVHPSWGINLDKGVYHCFSCGEDGTLLDLIMQLKGLSLLEARQWIGEAIPNFEDILDITSRIKQLDDNQPLYLDNIILDAYLNLEDVYESYRDIPFYIYKRYGVKYDPITERIAIPIRDEFGRLKAVVGRTAEDDGRLRYIPIIPERDVKFKDILYGLPYCLPPYGYRKPNEVTLYITEGYWGVYRLFQNGISDVVSLMGVSLTEGQFRLVVRFKQIILLLDPDDAGRKATKRIAKQLSKYVPCFVPRKQYGKEPDLWTKEDTFEALSSLKLAL